MNDAQSIEALVDAYADAIDSATQRGYENRDTESALTALLAAIANLRADLQSLRDASADVLASYFAEDCQECGIGQSDEWERLKALVQGSTSPQETK